MTIETPPFDASEEAAEDEIEDFEEICCWLTSHRICGADCVAYDLRSQTSAQHYPCRWINIVGIAATALTRLAKALEGNVQLGREQAEQLRERLKDDDVAKWQEKLSQLDVKPPEVS